MLHSDLSANDLRKDIEKYINLSVASSTKQTYSSGEKRFVEFCHLFKRIPVQQCLPATESLLSEFAVYLARTIKYSSIKNYLAAVRHYHICQGFQLNFQKMKHLQLVLRGIKRSQGDQIRIRLPITIHHLQLFHMLLSIPATQNYDSLMLWAAMTLAFFGFLRLGELTCNSKFNPDIHLTADNVSFSFNQSMHKPISMTILIKESKTDLFRVGQTITIGASSSTLCPVLAMKQYLSRRKLLSGPLFIHDSGKPLTEQTITNETRSLLTKLGFNAALYAGHSYRIGAATTAASAKLPSWLIKTLGRWSSDCYERYIKIPPATLSGVSITLTDMLNAK